MLKDSEQNTDDKILTLLQKALGVSVEEAKESLNVAKRKVEASMLVGVAGFWS